MASKSAEQIQEETRDYYGKELQSTSDLKTSACTVADRPETYIARAISRIHDEVASKFYGCGLIAPDLLEGLKILDLGSGSGRDVYVLSQLVGESGYVIGVDMTKEQLEVANKWKEWHRERFGYSRSNVEFIEGLLEDVCLIDAMIPHIGTFDVIVSNCVLNLCTDKEAVLRNVFSLLKPGGELYFSDVYADRRVPLLLQNDSVLYGECLSGALYWNDFLNMARRSGFADPRLVTSRPLTVNNRRLTERIGPIRFFSATYRLFKLDSLEPSCEQYGQAVRYRGTIPFRPHEFSLDDHHVFSTGRITPVCGNSSAMLQLTRFAPHFDFFGNTSQHFGIDLSCGVKIPFVQGSVDVPTSGGCC